MVLAIRAAWRPPPLLDRKPARNQGSMVVGVRADQVDRGRQVGTYVPAVGDPRGESPADQRHEDVALADRGIAYLVEDDLPGT